MNEKDVLVSHARELKEKSADQSVVTFTNFLSVDEQSDLITIEKENNKYVNTFYYGGYSEAERTVAFFVPKFIEIDDIFSFMSDNPEENPITLIKVTKDKFTHMSHRDYLGSLMALGIKREMLGDIIVDDNGCHFFCLKNIAAYICENLRRTGRGSVQCETVLVESLPQGKDNSEVLFVSVASMRLDAVVAAAFSMSRSKAFEFISRGFVYVNSVQLLKNDFVLNAGDKLVLRGKGKAVLQEIIGSSKKGRTHLKIKRYK